MTAAERALRRHAPSILGRALTDPEADLFSNYLILLLKWQRSQRLVGSDDPTWIVEKLFLDSLLFLRVLSPGVRRLLDLGAGAGFPGLPLAIISPLLSVALVEARRKRASFLSTVIRELGLTSVRVLNERAEALLPRLAGQFDAVVMRCAANPGDLIPLASRLVIKGGLVVASGPPSPRPLPPGGEWVEVPGLRAGERRRFAIYRRS